MYDVVIIGAGIVGALTARELTRYKLKVCVVDRENDVAMGATKANSAIVHAGFDAQPGTLKAKLNVEGSELMEQTAAELGVKYKRNGAIVLGFDDRAAIEKLYRQGIENGVKGIKILNKDELFALEPNLNSEAKCALYAPSSAIVCPYELCIAAMGNAMDNGAELKLNFNVTAIEKINNEFEVKSDTEIVKAKYVINAAGIYADRIAAFAGASDFKIRPRRGEYILLDKDCGNIVSHTIFQTPSKMGKGILVTPTVDRNLLLGPTSVDMEDKEDKGTTYSGFSDIIRTAGKSVRNIPRNKMITSFCGLRAVGSTGDFIINAPQKGFVNIAGIESPGLSSSPAIAKYAVQLLKEQGLKLCENESFNPIRKPMHSFADASTEEKNKIIKQNPLYGKVICRCETVTEGEIAEAIHTNPKARDIDGIKRRTRAGMGRCQGGFCMSYTAQILARETNCSLADITKFGGNSKIIVGKTKGEIIND